MTITRILTPLALAVTLAFAAAPVSAEQQRGGDRSGGRSREGGNRDSGSRGAVRRAPGPAVSRAVPRSRPSPSYRGSVRVAPRVIAPRGAYRGDLYRGNVYRGGVYRGDLYRGGIYGGGARFYRPYYSFRPRLSLGLGLWLGYPVAYPYYYGSPYGYPYPYAATPAPYGYGYPPPVNAYPVQPYASSPAGPGYYDSYDDPDRQDDPSAQSGPSLNVQPGQQSTPGGLSFEITPDTAAVFVDGTYVGTAADFNPTSQPLGLMSGRHQIELRASGYRTMTFDADITPGQVLPYRGVLQRN